MKLLLSQQLRRSTTQQLFAARLRFSTSPAIMASKEIASELAKSESKVTGEGPVTGGAAGKLLD